MAQGFTDFTGASVGSDPPAGWTARGSASAAWRVGAGPVVEWEDTESRFDFLTWDVPGNVSGDIEVCGEFESTNGGGGQGGICLQVQATGESGYFVGLAFGGLGFDEIFSNLVDAGAEDAIGAGVAFTWSINTLYRMRLRKFSSDNILRSRVWLAGDSEPGTWNLSLVADTTFTSGFVGLFGRNANGIKTWRRFGYGTDGDPAPFEPLGGAPSVASIIANITRNTAG